MALREFTDPAGNAWEAFAVVPRDQERRQYDRRSTETHVDEVEERREADRRLTVGRAELVVGGGWLCFQHGDERRRLTPIPADWEKCDEAQLVAYLDAARPVRHIAALNKIL